jgi:HPt (histidine-containing phosphotransfer) domain-containing protein
MAQPLSEYFALEAGEFLDQMDALLAGSDRPDPVRFFRLARGVRGSAQLAGATPIAGVAERLEDGARALRDGLLQWTPEVRDRARRTAEDLRTLVEAHARWQPEDDARAREAADRWADVDAGRRRGEAAGSGDQLFAFVRREIQGVVAEMDRVLAELAASPELREPLRVVLRRMRPVRGVAGMEALAPVLEVLEGIEDAAHEVLSRTAPVLTAELELLSAGGAALRASGTALERGQAPGESAELSGFRELRDRAEDAAADEKGVVPIGRLFMDGDGPHLVSSPMAPIPGEGEGAEAVEGFLRIESTGFLDRAEGLLASLPARPRRFPRVAREAAELAASVRELAGTYGAAGLAAAAEVAATRLRAATSPEEARDALQRLRYALPGATPAPAVEPVPASVPVDTAQAVDSVVAAGPPADEVRADEEGVVPVETLFYAGEDALREALALRPRIAQLAGGGRDTPLGEALDELFGLVELGLAARP